jgi:hypothetical protein
MTRFMRAIHVVDLIAANCAWPKITSSPNRQSRPAAGVKKRRIRLIS